MWTFPEKSRWKTRATTVALVVLVSQSLIGHVSDSSCGVCTFFLVLFIYAYCYLTRTHGYWAARGVSSPLSVLFCGTYLGQFFYSFHISEEERLKKHGHIYGIYEGTKPGLIVADPDLIKEIMVEKHAVFYNRRSVKTTHPIMSNFLSSLEDGPWKRVRSLVRSTFKPKELRTVYPHFQASGELLKSALDEAAATGTEIDLKALFGTYTMEVISRSCFATVPDEVFVHHASSLFTFPFWRKFLDYAAPMSVLDPLGFTVLPKTGMEFFRIVTHRLIAHRTENPDQSPQDFLDLLMKAKGEEDSDAIAKLSENEILSQSVLFFSVGYETSSQLLTYCAYCLALNPDIQDQLRDEILRVTDESSQNSSEISYDLLDESEYLAAVIAETLRLYNPVLRMERKASEDYELKTHDGKSILVPEGMVVGIPVWAIHHSEEFYPEPEKFDPERFLGEDADGWKKRGRTKFANVTPVPFLPFGIGPRNCIGTRFAIMETKLALMEILKEYRFVKTAGTSVPLKFFPTGRPLLGCDRVLVAVEKFYKTPS